MNKQNQAELWNGLHSGVQSVAESRQIDMAYELNPMTCCYGADRQ